MRHPNPLVEEADATYEIEKAIARAKGMAHSINLSMIERRFGFKRGTLASWRNNQFAPCKSAARRREYYLRKKLKRK